jgi:hypothetical protein
MSRHRKSPNETVTATEASTATRCGRQYYLEYVALVPVDAAAQHSRRAGTERHIEYTRQHFGVGDRRPRSMFRTIRTLIIVAGALTLALLALRAVVLLP